MLYAALAVMCIAFVEVFRLLRLQDQLTNTLRISRESLEIVRSETMTDDEKEVASRRSSIALFGQTGLFLGKLVLTLVGPAVVYLLAVFALKLDRAELDASLMSPLVWLAMTVLALIYVGIRHAVTRRL